MFRERAEFRITDRPDVVRCHGRMLSVLLGFGLGTTDHGVPFQCSISELLSVRSVL